MLLHHQLLLLPLKELEILKPLLSYKFLKEELLSLEERVLRMINSKDQLLVPLLLLITSELSLLHTECKLTKQSLGNIFFRNCSLR